MEAALWAALRSLEENLTLMKRLATQARERGNPRSAAAFQEKAESLDAHAEVIRSLLQREETPYGDVATHP